MDNTDYHCYYEDEEIVDSVDFVYPEENEAKSKANNTVGNEATDNLLNF